MEKTLEKIAEEKRNKNTGNIIFRLLILLMLLCSLVMACVAVKINPLFIIFTLFSFITGIIYSFFPIKKKAVKVLVGFAAAFLLINCGCCTFNTESFYNIKAIGLQIVLALQIFYIFFAFKPYNLKFLAYSSIVLAGLSVNVKPDGPWGIFIIIFMLLTILVFYYEDLLSRGYILEKFWNIFKDYDYGGMIVVIASIFIVALCLFTILPRAELRPETGIILHAEFDYDGELYVTPQKKQSGPSNKGGRGTQKPENKNTQDNNEGKGNNKPQKNQFDDVLEKIVASVSGMGNNSHNTTSSGNQQGSASSNTNNKNNSSISSNSHAPEDLLFSVETSKANLLREFAFDYFDGFNWFSSSANKVEILEPTKFIEYEISKPKTFTPPLKQSFEYSNMNSNIIISSFKPRKIYFPRKVKKIILGNNENLMSPVIMQKGFKYTSLVDINDPAKSDLMSADEQYEKQFKNQFASQFKQDLQVPDSTTTRTRKLVKNITKTAINDYEKVERIKKYLKEHYSYDKQPDKIPKNKNRVDYFLFQCNNGYVSDFTTAFVIMLRLEGIPARYVEGYYPGTYNPFTGKYQVKWKHFTSWAEVHIPGHGWITVHKNLIDFSDSLFYKLWRFIFELMMQIPFLATLVALLEWLFSLIAKNLTLVAIGIGELILFAALIFLIFKIIQFKSKKQQVLESLLYLKLCKKLKRYGYKKHPNETALGYLKRIKTNNNSAKFVIPLQQIYSIEQATRLYLDIRFGLDKEKLPKLKDTVQDIILNL